MSATIATTVLQYDSCKRWIEGFRSPATKRKYVCLMLKFCEFYQTTPDGLLAKTPEQLKNMAIDYVIHLKKVAKQEVGKAKPGEISVNSVGQYLSGVHHFLDFHEITINWKKIEDFYPEEQHHELVPYTLEQVKQLIAMADLRDRCLIYLFTSSGVRAGAIKTLHWEHIHLIPEYQMAFLEVYAFSKKDRYVTLVTPECLNELNKYKAWRISMGEKVTAKSPIIRDKFAPLSRTTNQAKALTYYGVSDAIRRLLKKAGMDYNNIQPDHGFRKFFATTARNARVDREFKRLMMGQSSDLEDIYDYNGSEESKHEFVTEYLKAVDALTINEENRLKKELKQVNKEKEELKEYILDLGPAMKEVQKQIAEMQRQRGGGL